MKLKYVFIVIALMLISGCSGAFEFEENEFEGGIELSGDVEIDGEEYEGKVIIEENNKYIIDEDFNQILFSKLEQAKSCEIDIYNNCKPHWGVYVPLSENLFETIDVMVEEYEQKIDNEKFLEYIKKDFEYQDSLFDLEEINGNEFYMINSDGRYEPPFDVIGVWHSENKVIIIIFNNVINLEDKDGVEDLLNAYFEKYPSDLKVNGNIEVPIYSDIEYYTELLEADKLYLNIKNLNDLEEISIHIKQNENFVCDKIEGKLVGNGINEIPLNDCQIKIGEKYETIIISNQGVYAQTLIAKGTSNEIENDDLEINTSINLCMADCTKGDNIFHNECIGVNSCSFIDNITTNKDESLNCEGKYSQEHYPLEIPYCSQNSSMITYHCFGTINTYNNESYVNLNIHGNVCEFGCIDGVCIEETQEEISTCSDSDDGLNYYEKGNTSGYNINEEFLIKEDYCYVSKNGIYAYEGENIAEFYCNQNDQFYPSYHTCEFGCIDGACKKENEFVLTDEFNFVKDKYTHNYKVEGSTYIGAYACDGNRKVNTVTEDGYFEESLRLSNCAHGEGSVSVDMEVTPNTKEIKLELREAIGYREIEILIDGVKFDLYKTATSCNYKEFIFENIQNLTYDGKVNIKINDGVPDSCSGDPQLIDMKLYSLN
jgi:hypothetical protein